MVFINENMISSYGHNQQTKRGFFLGKKWNIFFGANRCGFHLWYTLDNMGYPRFAEWSSACWDLQKSYLLKSNEDLDVRFLALYHVDDTQFMTSSMETLVGRCMNQWWDVSSEAGPKRREGASFQETPPALEVLSISTESEEPTVTNLVS